LLVNDYELNLNLTLDFQDSQEYIKCRKEICEESHGPYYYAYWKYTDASNNKKLKKKYIGTYLPPAKDKSGLK
jgi:hypothetical protein